MTAVRNIGFAALLLGLLLYAASSFVMRDTAEPFTDQDEARLEELRQDTGGDDLARLEEMTRLTRKATPDLPRARRRLAVANWGWLLTMAGAPIFAAGFIAVELRRPKRPAVAAPETSGRLEGGGFYFLAVLIFGVPFAMIVGLLALYS